MNDTLGTTIRYLFIMGVILILVAYWVGSTGLLKTIFSGANTIDLTATGRTANGTFPGYPATA